MRKRKAQAEIIKLNAKINIEERRHDALDKHFLETKSRRLLLVSAELAIFVYLFSDLRNMIPKELYGTVFFAIGVISAIASLFFSFYHLRPIKWPNPIGPVETVKIDAAKSELEWKKIIYDDYCSCNNDNAKILTYMSRTLVASLIFFVISVTILLIIKFF